MKHLQFFLFFPFLFVLSSAYAQLPIMLGDFNPAGSSSMTGICGMGNRVYFVTGDNNVKNLYSSDGTPAGTILIEDSVSSINLGFPAEYNGLIYFLKSAPAYGKEIWVTDGTPHSAVMLKDINPGPDGSDPFYATVFDGRLFFQAHNDTYGQELFVTDGTTAGTTIFKDCNPLSASSYPVGFKVVGNDMYFVASNGINGVELWISDGTSPGTLMVKDINPGSGNADIQTDDFCEYGGNIYFRADDGIHGPELWKSDGTTAGTVMVKDIYSGLSGSHVSGIKKATFGMSSRLVFIAYDSLHGQELWKSDGTDAGTVMIKDINPGIGGGAGAGPDRILYYAFKTYFLGDNGIDDAEIWTTNGTDAGTSMIKDIHPTDGSFPVNFILYHGKVFFKADDGTNGGQVWYTDATPAGTGYIVPAIVTDPNPIPNFWNRFVWNGILYYEASYNTSGKELWALDIPWVITTASSPVAGGITSGGGGYHTGDSVTLTATPNPSYSFVNWTENSVVVSTSPVYSFICGSDDRNLTANFQLTTGIEEAASVQMQVCPNPADHFIWVNPGIQPAGEFTCSVFAMDGRLVICKKLQSDGEFLLDISQLPSGVLSIRLENESFSASSRFIRQ